MCPRQVLLSSKLTPIHLNLWEHPRRFNVADEVTSVANPLVSRREASSAELPEGKRRWIAREAKTLAVRLDGIGKLRDVEVPFWATGFRMC